MDILCKCEHEKKVHPPSPCQLGTYRVCDGCFKANRINGVKQYGTFDCLQYVPDNLTHIEVLAREREI